MRAFQLTGLLGWAERVITALGEWGVALVIALETVFPPVPSEVVLPLAGYLNQQGGLGFWRVRLTSTLGSYVGALALYGGGHSSAWNGQFEDCPSCRYSIATIWRRRPAGSNGTARPRCSSAGLFPAYGA